MGYKSKIKILKIRFWKTLLRFNESPSGRLLVTRVGETEDLKKNLKSYKEFEVYRRRLKKRLIGRSN